MKKLVSGVLTVAVACLAAVALAGSPAKVSGTVATNGVNLTVPASGSVAFRVQAVVFDAAADTTQTVSLVHGSITNQLGTKAVSATDKMLTVTNAPWLFAGESVRITTTATNAYSAVVIGETED